VGAGRTETCKDLCLRVLQECPWGQFRSGDVRYVIEVKHGRSFSHSSVNKALRDLWKAEQCESLIGGAGPALYVLKNSRELTPEERADRDEWQAKWLAHHKGTEDEGMVGPTGLLPEEVPLVQDAWGP
jgi:hypothetical protein